MKVLWVDFALPYLLKDASYPVGGWAVELTSWLAGLSQAGHRSGVLTWRGANEFVGKEQDFDLLETYDPKVGTRFLKYYFQYLPALQSETARYAPDIIIQACSGLLTGMMCLVARRLSIPFLYRAASDMDTDGRYKNHMKLYQQLAYRYGLQSCQGALCQNQYQYRNLRSEFPLKPLQLLPNPFEIRARSKLIRRQDRSYVAWLGVFRKQKNLPLLFEIARQMPKTNFKIGGTPSGTIDTTTDHALRQLETLENVQFVGYLGRMEVVNFLSDATLLLNTSHFEGFSNTYLEAFSAGTPVVASVNADPGSIIARHDLGRSVADPDEYTKQISNLLDTNLDYDGMSRRCREYVDQHHNPKMLAKRLVRFSKSIISQFPGSP